MRRTGQGRCPRWTTALAGRRLTQWLRACWPSRLNASSTRDVPFGGQDAFGLLDHDPAAQRLTKLLVGPVLPLQFPRIHQVARGHVRQEPGRPRSSGRQSRRAVVCSPAAPMLLRLGAWGPRQSGRCPRPERPAGRCPHPGEVPRQAGDRDDQRLLAVRFTAAQAALANLAMAACWPLPVMMLTRQGHRPGQGRAAGGLPGPRAGLPWRMPRS